MCVKWIFQLLNILGIEMTTTSKHIAGLFWYECVCVCVYVCSGDCAYFQKSVSADLVFSA